jgi:hypothetical protein
VIIAKPEARFMLVSNYPIGKQYKLILKNINIEFKSVNKDNIIAEAEAIVEVQKGNSKYKTKENILEKLSKQKRIATEILEFVSRELHTKENPILCNISDGIMFQLVTASEKFLSISTIGNRLLLHFPDGKRDEVYNNYKMTLPEIYCYRENHPNERDKEQNQIDIKLKYIKNLEYIKPLIYEAYNKSFVG